MVPKLIAWCIFYFEQRNGTLSEIATINSGMNGMDKFGYLDRLNGLDHLPFWKDKPCSNIFASEGSFFPPRAFTNSNVVYVYDKDLCRVLPLEYVRPMEKDGELSENGGHRDMILLMIGGYCANRNRSRFVRNARECVWRWSNESGQCML